jgi:hypothetical protein
VGELGWFGDGDGGGRMNSCKGRMWIIRSRREGGVRGERYRGSTKCSTDLPNIYHLSSHSDYFNANEEYIFLCREGIRGTSQEKYIYLRIH